MQARGGLLTTADLEAYRVLPRPPLSLSYRGHEVYTDPPPSAGGSRLARAMAHLATGRQLHDELEIAAALAAGEGSDPVTVAAGADRLGSTTHISVLDADGWACSVTCSNGTCSGVTVPGTGIHLNNMLGEDDLAPGGLGSHRLGERLPSGMAPTVVRADGAAELVVGSAGSSRIRSALLQVITNMVDRGMSLQRAVDAPRLHVEQGRAYAEPGIDGTALERAGYPVARFSAPNLFFGGCQAARRDLATGGLAGGADARRAARSLWAEPGPTPAAGARVVAPRGAWRRR